MSHVQYDHAPQSPPQDSGLGRGTSRVLPILGALLGLLGLIVGVAAWLRAAPSDSALNPVYSEQQVADAKKAVCEAYEKGFRSIGVAVAKKPDETAEPLPGALLNARIAEIAVANYFFHSLNTNPATPSAIKDLIRQLGESYQNIALTQLADGTREEVRPIAEYAGELAPKIEYLCR